MSSLVKIAPPILSTERKKDQDMEGIKQEKESINILENGKLGLRQNPLVSSRRGRVGEDPQVPLDLVPRSQRMEQSDDGLPVHLSDLSSPADPPLSHLSPDAGHREVESNVGARRWSLKLLGHAGRGKGRKLTGYRRGRPRNKTPGGEGG